MTMAFALPTLSGHGIFAPMIGLVVPDVFDHHAAIEDFDVARMISFRAAAANGSPEKEAFSFRVCQCHTFEEVRPIA